MQSEPTSLRIKDPGIRILFSDESRLQSWLDVEAALAQAQASLGIIPNDAAKEITRKSKLCFLNMDAIQRGLEHTGHQLVPLIWELDRICDEEAGGYVHWGATTQNITQTGRILVLKRVHNIILGQLADLLDTTADLAELTKEYFLPGRTHGQHAVPITFGFKVAVWIDEISNHVVRFSECEKRLFVVMLGGATGTAASPGESGLSTQNKMAGLLDMHSMKIPARTMSDHFAEYVSLLGMLSATSGKIGRELYTLMKQEFGELEEPVPEGTVGSSTMPQKRNPKLAQDIIAGAAIVRSLVPLAFESMLTEHEADRTTTIMMNRAIEEACITTGDILQRLVSLFSGIKLFPDRMRRNLELADGLIMAESVMLALGKLIGRQKAHDIVYDCAQTAFLEGKSFHKTLSAKKEVSSHLTPDDIDRLLNPSNHIGVCIQLAETHAVNARTVSSRLRGRLV